MSLPNWPWKLPGSQNHCQASIVQECWRLCIYLWPTLPFSRYWKLHALICHNPIFNATLEWVFFKVVSKELSINILQMMLLCGSGIRILFKKSLHLLESWTTWPPRIISKWWSLGFYLLQITIPKRSLAQRIGLLLWPIEVFQHCSFIHLK